MLQKSPVDVRKYVFSIVILSEYHYLLVAHGPSTNKMAPGKLGLTWMTLPNSASAFSVKWKLRIAVDYTTMWQELLQTLSGQLSLRSKAKLGS